MRLSASGGQIGLMTSDGYVKLIDEKTHNFIYAQKRHRLPVTSLGFKYDTKGNVEYLISGSADYTYNIINVKQSTICKHPLSLHV